MLLFFGRRTEMDEQSSVTNLRDFIPNSVDDIIRAHRSECQLTWATSEELERRKGDLQNANLAVRSTLCNWNVLMFHLTLQGRAMSALFLVGAVQDSRQPWVTSAVEAVDLGAGSLRPRIRATGLSVPVNPNLTCTR
jgi:hypothetical protein